MKKVILVLGILGSTLSFGESLTLNCKIGLLPLEVKSKVEIEYNKVSNAIENVKVTHRALGQTLILKAEGSESHRNGTIYSLYESIDGEFYTYRIPGSAFSATPGMEFSASVEAASNGITAAAAKCSVQ